MSVKIHNDIRIRTAAQVRLPADQVTDVAPGQDLLRRAGNVALGDSVRCVARLRGADDADGRPPRGIVLARPLAHVCVAGGPRNGDVVATVRVEVRDARRDQVREAPETRVAQDGCPGDGEVGECRDENAGELHVDSV